MHGKKNVGKKNLNLWETKKIYFFYKKKQIAAVPTDAKS
jgi:hypothetical protein